MDHLFGKTLKYKLLYLFNLATRKKEMSFKTDFSIVLGVSKSGNFLKVTLNIVIYCLNCRFS